MAKVRPKFDLQLIFKVVRRHVCVKIVHNPFELIPGFIEVADDIRHVANHDSINAPTNNHHGNTESVLREVDGLKVCAFQDSDGPVQPCNVFKLSLIHI